MQSMTGYGRARVCREGREISLEIKSVNHRFLDLSFRVPKNIAFIEDVLRTGINQSGLCRGHVDVSVTYQNQRADAQQIIVDPVKLGAFKAAMENCGDQLTGYTALSAA